jgi:hypothetical protein
VLEDQHLTKHQVASAIDGQKTAPSQPLVWNISGYDSKTDSRE